MIHFIVPLFRIKILLLFDHFYAELKKDIARYVIFVRLFYELFFYPNMSEVVKYAFNKE